MHNVAVVHAYLLQIGASVIEHNCGKLRIVVGSEVLQLVEIDKVQRHKILSVFRHIELLEAICQRRNLKLMRVNLVALQPEILQNRVAGR